jgi:hypothetical protein
MDKSEVALHAYDDGHRINGENANNLPICYGTNAIIQLIHEYNFICAPFIRRRLEA